MKVNNDENIKKLADKEFLKKLYEILELMGWDYGIDYSEASNFVRWTQAQAWDNRNRRHSKTGIVPLVKRRIEARLTG